MVFVFLFLISLFLIELISGNNENIKLLKNNNISQDKKIYNLTDTNKYVNTEILKLKTDLDKSDQENIQNTSVTGTLFGSSNTFSSIMSRNKEESKYSDNNMSTSKSYGEFIIDNQINKKMEGDKDFKNFMKMNDANIGDSGSIDDDKYNKDNKKDVNFYNKKRKYRSNPSSKL